MEELEYVPKLDLPVRKRRINPSVGKFVNVRAILAKLVYKLREQWRRKPHDMMENTGFRAGFSGMY